MSTLNAYVILAVTIIALGRIAICNRQTNIRNISSWCVVGYDCKLSELLSGLYHYVSKDCSRYPRNDPRSVDVSSMTQLIPKDKWSVLDVKRPGEVLYLCRGPFIFDPFGIFSSGSKIYAFYPPEFEHYLDRNNELRISFNTALLPKIDLGVSINSLTKLDISVKRLSLAACPEVLFGYKLLPEVYEYDIMRDILEIYVYLYPEPGFDQLIPLKTIHAFNIGKIRDISYRVTSKAVILKIEGVAPGRGVKYSVQSSESVYGTGSLCGKSDTLWHILDLPHYSNEGQIYKYLAIGLPIGLLGQTVTICASPEGSDFSSYRLPVSTVFLDSKTSKYHPYVFNADAMGITDIVFDADVHPYSEIMLIEEGSLLKKSESISSPLKASIFSGEGISRINDLSSSNLNGAMLDIEDSLKGVSFSPGAAHVEVWNLSSFSRRHEPHGLVFPPEKSYRLNSKRSWSIKKMFFPKLFAGSSGKYVIMLCDRWKHPHCLTSSEFDRVMGYVLPKNFIHSNMNIEMANGGFTLKIVTLQDVSPTIKLTEAQNVQYANLDEICNTRIGILANFESQKKNSEYDKMTTYEHIYKLHGVVPGVLYYVCYVFPDPSTLETDGWNIWIKAKENDPKFATLRKVLQLKQQWKILSIVNTQSPLLKQRYTFPKLDADTKSLHISSNGYTDPLNLSGIYLSENLLFSCSRLLPHALTRTSYKYAKNTTKTDERGESLVINVKPNDTYSDRGESVQKVDLSDGFWLEHKESSWSVLGSYLRYNETYKPKRNMYKMCICANGYCFNGGTLVRSHIETFDLRQLDVANDIYDRIILGSLLCLYNTKGMECFEAADDLTDFINKVVKVDYPYTILRSATFDENKNLIVTAAQKFLVYKNDFKKFTTVITDANSKEVYSFDGISFVLLLDNSIVFRTDEASLSRQVDTPTAVSTKLHSSENGAQSGLHTVGVHDQMPKGTYIKLEGVTGKINELCILRLGSHKDKFNFFFIDDVFVMHHHICEIHAVDGKKEARTTIKSSVKLNEYLPRLERKIILKAKYMEVHTGSYLFLFVYCYGDDTAKVFRIVDDTINFYANISTPTKMVDFVLTKTHLISLNTNISMHKEISQSLSQFRLDTSLAIHFHYPSWVHRMQQGVAYTFEPKVTNGILFHYYMDDISRLNSIGFSLNESTGVISGLLTFAGTANIEVFADGFLGKASVSLMITSKCSVGSKYDQESGKCVQCEIGTFGDSSESGNCLKCTDFIANSTTLERGAKTSLQCVCKPGYYLYEKRCIPCRAGTFSELYGSTACTGTCPKNQKSSVSGASSLSMLKCTCKEGYYRKDNVCLACIIGHYCLGGEFPPTPCGDNMTTLKTATPSQDGCVCDLGFKWVSGVCVPCSSMEYKDVIGNTGCTPCSDLNSGSGVHTYAPMHASTKKQDCSFCKQGYYYDRNRLTCEPCPIGNYCLGAGAAPTICAIDTVNRRQHSTNRNYCLCRKGFGFNSPGRYLPNLENNCSVCPANTFQHVEGAGTQCIPCPANSYTISQGSTSIADCLPNPGYYNFLGEMFHSLAAELEVKYNPDNDKNIYVSCQTDFKLERTFSVTVLQRSLKDCVDLCKANLYCRYVYYVANSGLSPHLGYVVTVGVSSPYVEYYLCGLIMSYESFKFPILESSAFIFDSKTPNKHLGLNVLCEVKRTHETYTLSDVSVIKCPSNHYCPGGRSFSKLRCPYNSITLSAGATSVNHCLCLPGSEPSDINRFIVCRPCKKGFYKFEISNERCKPCPKKMVTSEEGSVSISQCVCVPSLYAVALDKTPGLGTRDSNVDHNTKNMPLKLSGSLSSFIYGYIRTSNAETANYSKKTILECKKCPKGYYCSGNWLFLGDFLVHNPPASCPAGSVVPAFSHNASSISKCLCYPGYGVRSTPDGTSRACQICPPGTFRETYENISCPGRCNEYAITLPGASSFQDCFCLPGRFMMVRMVGNDYEFVCVKCVEGAVCPGGFRTIDPSTNKSIDGQPFMLKHVMPIPRAGYIAMFRLKKEGYDGLVNSIAWRPDMRQTYITEPPDPRDFEHYESVPDVHACAYSSRCRRSDGHTCINGSDGYICGQCVNGYDVDYFQSDCSKCESKVLEAVKLLLPRFLLLFFTFLVCYTNKEENMDGEFSLVTIFKIWYMFVLSLIPFGLQPMTSVSSLRRFYDLYRRFFNGPILLYVYNERLGCWEGYLRKFIFIINKFGVSKALFDGSKMLDYTRIWYFQRFVGLSKPVIDVTLLLIFYVIAYALSTVPSFNNSSGNADLFFRISLLHDRCLDGSLLTGSNISSTSDIKSTDSGGSDVKSLSEGELNFTGEEKYVKNNYGNERTNRKNLLYQQIVVLLALHFPGVCLNSMSMLWCRPVRYKQEVAVNVLLHLPNQVCDLSDDLYRYGRIIGIFSLILWLTLLFTFFIELSVAKYNSNSWKSVFMTGCSVACRWWDAVHLSRQFFLVLLIVAQYSVDPKGDSEYIRTLCYFFLTFIYMTLHLIFSPYDYRSDNMFYRLENSIFFTNLGLSIFIQGSYFYDFSGFSGLPIIVSLYVHFKIIWCILTEYGKIRYLRSKFSCKGSFITKLLGGIPSKFQHGDFNIYYDYKQDTLILEEQIGRGKQGRASSSIIGRPISRFLKFFSGGSSVFWRPGSVDYLSQDRSYLEFCIITAIERASVFSEHVELSNLWFYFIVRYSFWYCQCLDLDIFSTNLSDKDLLRKIIFLYFFPRAETDPLVLSFLENFPLDKLSPHATVLYEVPHRKMDHEVTPDGNAKRRLGEVAESLLVYVLFDTFCDDGPITVTEFYFALLSINRIGNSAISRIFEAFKMYSSFLKDKRDYYITQEAKVINEDIANLNKTIESESKSGSLIHQYFSTSYQISEMKNDIGELKASIDREHQIIMAGRSAALAALNLHLGVNNIVNCELSHDDILAAISEIGDVSEKDRNIGPMRRKGISAPVQKLKH